MKRNDGSLLWQNNKEWYRWNKKTLMFELTNEAPEEAKISFEKYKMNNGYPDTYELYDGGLHPNLLDLPLKEIAQIIIDEDNYKKTKKK